MSRRLLCLAFAFVVAVAPGCGKSPGAGNGVGPEAALDGRTFIGNEVVGRLLVAGTEIRMSFDGDRLGASAGCNSISGIYAIEHGVLLVERGQLAGTDIGCDAKRHAQDRWLSDLLTSSPTVELSGDSLSIRGTRASMELIDRRIADPDRRLVGTSWQIDSLITGDAVASVSSQGTVTIRFSDNARFEAVAASCTSTQGSVVITQDQIEVGPFTVDTIACGASWEHTLQVLRSGRLRYEIEADRLTVRAAEIGFAAVAL